MNHHKIHPKDKIAPDDRGGKNPKPPTSESQKDDPIGYHQLYEQTKEREVLLMQSLIKNETLLDEGEDVISETDLKGTVTYSNNAASRFWGISNEQVIGLNYKSWSDPVNQKIAFDAYTNVYKTGRPCRFSYEIPSKFIFISKAFNLEKGTLTQTIKLNRGLFLRSIKIRLTLFIL